MEPFGSLRESKQKLRELFTDIKKVNFLNSRKNQNKLNGWMTFYDAKSCFVVKICIDREHHFGIEIIKERETAPMQLAIQKQVEKPFKKPLARLWIKIEFLRMTLCFSQDQLQLGSSSRVSKI